MSIRTKGHNMSSGRIKGHNISRIRYKGQDIYKDSEPFYWIKNGSVQSGFPSTYSISKSPSQVWTKNLLTNFYCSCGSLGSTGYLSGSTSKVETKGNKYMSITVTFDIAHGGGSFSINGTTITTAGTHIIDVSNVDSVSISASLWSYAYSATGSAITNIYFYS